MSGVGEQVVGMWFRTMYEDQGYGPTLDGSVLMERLIDEAVAAARNEALDEAAKLANAIADAISLMKPTSENGA